MSLEDLEKKIYKKEDREQLDMERNQNTPYSIYGDHKKVTDNGFQSFEKASPTFMQKYKKQITRFALVALGISFVGVLTLFVYNANQQRFSARRVSVEITGEKEINSGEEVEYTLTYKNDNLVALRDASITVDTPQSLVDSEVSLLGTNQTEVRQFELPELAPRSTGTITIKGRMIAEKGSVQFFRATLTYIPTIVTSSFETKTELAVNVVDSPIIINIQTPLEAVSGNEVRYSIAVNNTGDTDLENLELRLAYPEGFAFVSATQPVGGNGDNTFTVRNLRSQGVYEVTVIGNLGGELGDIKVIKAEIGEVRNEKFTIYANGQSSTKLGEPYVSVRQTVQNAPDKIVEAGESLEYVVTIENNTDVQIGEGVLKVTLDSSLLDLGGLQIPGADFDAGTNTIIWRANALNELRVFPPGARGTVTFRVPVKSRIPIDSFDDTNYVIKTQAYFESDQIPTPLGVNKVVQGNSQELKLATKFIPKIILDYGNSTTSILNTGPVPPVVGQQTTFTVSLEAQNLTNDVSGVSFVMDLGSNVSWTGQTVTGGIGTLTYNDRTKQVTWDVGKVLANTGILRQLLRASFQVSVSPTENQRGSALVPVRNIRYTATDDFTGLRLDGTLESPDSLRDGTQLKVE